jgi:homoserine dehydrogenase
VRLDLFLVGFGHVGRRFVRLLDESHDALAAMGLDVRVVGIRTARHGAAFDAAGLDAVAAAGAVEAGGTLSGGRGGTAAQAIAAWRVPAARTRILVETTPLDVRRGEPAASHIRAALAAGAHVVTANKGPIACAHRSLARAAARAGRHLLFEGAVMDGIPILSLVRETMPALTLRGFRGVVNSTTNYLLDAMERGERFETALARMQAAGVAEADPSLDVNGWDAAAKVAALANVWLDANTTPADVPRDRVGPETARAVQAVRRHGQRLKLVGRAARDRAGRVRASVRLEALAADDPLAILDGQANALEIDTWPLGRIVVTQRDGGLEKTAYALLADVVTVATRPAPRHPPAPARRRR